MAEDMCPFCGGLLHGYMRRELVEDPEDGSFDTEFVDYEECENCNREPEEAGDYEGIEVYG